MTANQSPYCFKELEHLRWQTTELQHVLINRTILWVGVDWPLKLWVDTYWLCFCWNFRMNISYQYHTFICPLAFRLYHLGEEKHLITMYVILALLLCWWCCVVLEMAPVCYHWIYSIYVVYMISPPSECRRIRNTFLDYIKLYQKRLTF